MRVTHVVRQYLPSVGGMEEVVRSLAASQLHAGVWEPSILTLDRVFRDRQVPLPVDEVIEGVPVRRLAWRGSERYPLAPAVLAHLKDVDLIHVHGIDFFFDFLALSHWFHRVPMVVSTHGGFFHTDFASNLKLVYFNSISRLSAKAYSKVICTSESDGGIFSKIVSPEKISVIENGVDVDKFKDAASKSMRPVMIYFGRWSENKGLFEAVRVFSDLVKFDPQLEWNLIIAGREFDISGEALGRHAERLGVADRVEIVESPSVDRLRNLISEASFFICLSRHEGFGIAPIEAMSAGLVPVLSDIPPFRKLIRTSGCGLLLEGARDHCEDILKLIRRSQSSEVSWAEVRALSVSAAQTYSWDQAAKKYTEEYVGATNA